MTLSARLLSDFRRIKQRGDDRRGADAHRDAGFHQLRSALLIGSVVVVVAVIHRSFSMASSAGWEAG